MSFGDLEILNLHATGGMAEIYRARARDEDGNETILAVKKILPQFTRDKDVLRMFIEEARVAALLDHPNIVRVFDFAVGDASSKRGTTEYYIVMEFADGKDLSDVIWEAVQRRQRVPLGVAVQAARDVARALHHAWNAPDDDGRPLRLIHRDVSPHNVLLTWDGRIKLTDFGIAKVQAAAPRTQAGIIRGKLGYMSPEQARARPLDQRTDLYNTGILLYESITGERLFDAERDGDVLEQMRNARIPRLDPALLVPGPLEAFLRRALAREPDDRPANAAVFEAELLAASEQSRVSLRPQETAQLLSGLFPKLARSAALPQPEATARLNLKSQLFGADFGAAVARAVARPGSATGVPVQAAGRAAALAEPTPASSSAPGPSVSSSAPAAPRSRGGPSPALPGPVPPTSPPSTPSPSSSLAGSARPLPAIDVVGGGNARAVLDSDVPPVGAAAIRGGAGARMLDDDGGQRPAPRRPATSSRVVPLPSVDAAQATRVELNPVGDGARRPPPSAASSLPGQVPPLPAPAGRPLPGQRMRDRDPVPPAVSDPSTEPSAQVRRPAVLVRPPMAPSPRPPSDADPAPWDGSSSSSPSPASPWAPPPLPPPLMPSPLPPPPPSGVGGAGLDRADAAWEGGSSKAAWSPSAAPPMGQPWGPPVAPGGPQPSEPGGGPPWGARHAGSPTGTGEPASSWADPFDGSDPPVFAAAGDEGDAVARAQAPPPAGAAAGAPAAPIRKSSRQVAREIFVERWVPTGVRVVGSLLLVVGLGGGAAGGLAVQEALAERAARRTRTLVARTTPAGAPVFLDGQKVAGVTPVVIDVELDDGPHVVRILPGKGLPIERKVVLGAQDRSIVVQAALQVGGRVTIATRPPGARILVDDRDVGPSPVTLDELAPDRAHTVEARLDGHRSAQATIPIERGPDHAVTLTLPSTAPAGRLVVVSVVPADVAVDGVWWGTTSSQLEDGRACPAGPHELTIVALDGGTRRTLTVDVPARGTARVFIEP